MWDEEDNNPYGSFHQDSIAENDHDNPALSSSYTEQAATPPSSQASPQRNPAFYSRDEDSSEDETSHDQQQAVPRKGGYDGRIQQILYENPELEILIIEAGKSSHGNFIEYRIRTGEMETARRYSEFASLRTALVSLHPTLVVPPIPEKHSMADYAAKPTKAKEDRHVIDQRKRMLAVFLNRCRRMQDVMDDGVFWRFLDPNSSWNEVLHAHPVSSVPKNNLKTAPLDPANPTPAHQWLPVPSANAKLRSPGLTSSSGTPVSTSEHSTLASTATHTTPGPQVFGRFPQHAEKLSEVDLDPYFINFEASTKELELLLQGSIDKVNRRTLEHLSKLSADLNELGARYNGFSLSEQAPSVAAAIERIGQAVDSTYLSTEDLANGLGASVAEPMRESAQFAGVVRSVLRYRVLKRVQQEQTRDELDKKRALLDQLQRSEQESKRIDQYLSQSTANLPQRSASSASARSTASSSTPKLQSEETRSIDSDFPPTHSEMPSSPPTASSNQAYETPTSPQHKKTQSGNFVTNKIFGSFRHAVNGFVDSDPEKTRRDQMGKTKDSLSQLEQALEVSEKDVKDATQGVMKDLKRFQKEKEDDMNKYMIAYARCHIEWARKNLETWSEAKEEVDKIRGPQTAAA